MLSVNSQTKPSPRHRPDPAALFWMRAALVLTIGLGSVTLANRVPADPEPERQALFNPPTPGGELDLDASWPSEAAFP